MLEGLAIYDGMNGRDAVHARSLLAGGGEHGRTSERKVNLSPFLQSCFNGPEHTAAWKCHDA